MNTNQKTLRRRFTQMNADGLRELGSWRRGLPQRTRRGAKGMRLETRSAGGSEQMGQKMKSRGILSKATRSGGLAACCRPSSGFGPAFLRNDGINHSARNNSLDTALGGSSCAAKGIWRFTEQGIHIGGPAFVGTEMNGQ